MVYKIHASRWWWGVKEVAAPPTFKLSGWTWFMVIYSYSGHPPFHNGSVECSHIVWEKRFSTEESVKRHANFTTSYFMGGLGVPVRRWNEMTGLLCLKIWCTKIIWKLCVLRNKRRCRGHLGSKKIRSTLRCSHSSNNVKVDRDPRPDCFFCWWWLLPTSCDIPPTRLVWPRTLGLVRDSYQAWDALMRPCDRQTWNLKQISMSLRNIWIAQFFKMMTCHVGWLNLKWNP